MHDAHGVYDAYMSAVVSTATSEPPSLAPQRATKTGPIIAVLAAAGIVVSLAQTLVIPIIGSLPQIFDTSASNTAWIITITLLVGAVSTPVMGRLADMYGKKRMMLIALIPFIVGSIVSALAGDVVTMIVGRGLQGLASGLVPLGIALLHDVLPKDKAGSAIALMSSSMGIGGALGIPIAAAVAQFADWRALFWAITVIAVLVYLAIWRIVPSRTESGQVPGFDFFGAVGLAIGLVSLLLAISKGAEWGWTSTLTLSSFATAVVVLGLWGWYQLHRRNPLVDLRTMAKPVVLLTNIASILIGFTMYAMSLIVPQVMQMPAELGFGLGQSMLQMGLWIAPMGIGMMAVSNLGAWISRTRGPQVTLTISGVVIAMGYGLTAIVLATIGSRAPGNVDPDTILQTLLLILVGTVITGCGVGLAFGAMPALIMGAVPADEKAAANGFNSLMRSLGTTICAAIIGVVLASMSQQFGDSLLPTRAGIIVSLLIGCGVALVAGIIAATIPRKARAEAAH